MRYVDHGLVRDDRAWRDPEIEDALDRLGYTFIGALGVSGGPSMEHARGDMDDADLEYFLTGSARRALVFWHPELRVFAELTGWLDAQRLLILRTDLADGAIVRTQTRYARMPRWRSKHERVEPYLRRLHVPRAGAFAHIADGTPEERHAEHLANQAAAAGARRTEPLQTGTMEAYIEGSRRLLEFSAKVALTTAVTRLALRLVCGAVVLVALVVLALGTGMWRTGALVAGLLGAAGWWVIGNRPDRVPRLFTPSMPGIGDPTPLIDEV